MNGAAPRSQHALMLASERTRVLGDVCNLGEQGRVDLLTALVHVLGLDHLGDGFRAESLAAGIRRTPAPADLGDW